MKAKERIVRLMLCTKFSLTGGQIANICHIGSWRLYPILAQLENDGRLKSYWGEGPEPRNRFYEWNPKTEAY